MIESCFYTKGLPNFGMFTNMMNVYSFLSSFLFFFSLFIFHASPRSKEANFYRILKIIQYVSLFVASTYWFIAKVTMDTQLGFMYIEGFRVWDTMHIGHVFAVVEIAFGVYQCCLQGAFMFRLQAIAHKNHIVHNVPIVNGYMTLFTLYVLVLQPLVFAMSYVNDVNAEGNPFKNLNQQEKIYMLKRNVIWYPFGNTRCLIFVVTVFLSFSYTIVFLVVLSREIVSEIKKKESISSSSSLNHHRKVLRSLIIQTSGTALILFPAPCSVVLQIFTSFSICFTQGSLCTFGLCFLVNTGLLLVVNGS